MKDLIGTIVIMLMCITALAQQNRADDAIVLARPWNKPNPVADKKEQKEHPSYNYTSPVSAQMFVGSQGVGADVKYGFLNNLSGRAGFAIIPVDASRAFSFASFPVQGHLNSRFSNAHLLADYRPFKTDAFRLVGGAAYLVEGSANFLIVPQENYTIGSRTVKQGQLGVLTASVSWSGVAPYLGFAVMRGFPNRLFNVNFDIGTYYLSSPNTTFTGTNLLADNANNEKIFHSNMSGYRWLPVLQMNFNFRIK